MAIVTLSVRAPSWAPLTANSLKEFYDLLERHDWFYSFSDDHSVWLAGNRRQKELQAIAENGGQEYIDLLKAYEDHMYSGKPWDNEQAPKPARPA